MNFNRLSLMDKFGQMILLGLDVYEINDEIIKIIQKYKIGGVVIYKKNYTSLETMIEVINRLKKVNENNKIPLFIGIDQENGRVNRFPKDVLQITSAYKQAKTENMKIINAVNKITSYLLASVGVNLNFAPVLDIKSSSKSKGIGNRSYGKTADKVIKYGIPFMKELQKNNIISVVKHFPILGANNRDNLFFVPKVKDLEILEENLKVYDAAIKSNADAIMISHIKIKGYGWKPASLNKKIIQDFLINKYNYKGLLITDDLRNNALRKSYGVKKSVQKSIEAGNNMVLIKYRKGDINKLYRDLFEMVKYCEIDPELINDSAKKIVSLKKKYNVTDELLNPKLELSLINEKIKNINNTIDREIGEYI